jgi:hypothetical protein
VPSPALTQEYQQQRAQMEVRHQQEFANPPKAEAPAQLQQRQEAEHQTVDHNYAQARVSGAEHMPAPVAPRAPAPAPAPRAAAPARQSGRKP